MEPSVNAVIKWSVGRRERILGYSSNRREIITIDIDDKKALPMHGRTEEVEAAIQGGLGEVLFEDPKVAPYMHQSDDDIPESFRNVRERRWNVIGWLVSDCGIFNPVKRSVLINAAAFPESRWSKVSLYRMLRRYWQYGQSRNALLPDYDKCGNKGQLRLALVRGVKRGRPQVHEDDKTTYTRLNAGPAMHRKFKRWLEREYDVKENPSLHDTYLLMCGAEYSRGYKVKDGLVVPKLLPASQRPSFQQFRYYFNTYHDPERSAQKRHASVTFDRDFAVRDGDTSRLAFGPASLYLFDGSCGDVNLGEELRKLLDELDIRDEDDEFQLIGKSEINVIGDSFTHAIIMANATLKHESYESFAHTFELATMDKVEYCRHYGITISKEQWPFQHLPESILADRGPLRGKLGDHLVNSFGIELQNTAPYRPDLKGFIERVIRTIKSHLLHKLPGAVKGRRRPGDPDPRLQTALTLRQLNRLLIQETIYHNNFRRLKKYPLCPDMRRDRVEPYPVDLWNWGIRRRSGVPRTMPQPMIRMKLLPRDRAVITEHGLYFRGLYYGCKEEVFRKWRFRAKHKGSWKVEIAYDPRLVDVLYLIQDNGRRFVNCELKGISTRFQGRTWDEVLAIQHSEKGRANHARGRDEQAALEHALFVRNEIRSAAQKRVPQKRASTRLRTNQKMYGRRKAAAEFERVTQAQHSHGRKDSKPASLKQDHLVKHTTTATRPQETRVIKKMNQIWKGGSRV